MAKFTSKDRQRIIDEYLASTRRNMFVAGEFIDWLGRNPGHEAYEWFFSKSDTEAAREYRIGLARQMASGLRITLKVSDTPKSSVSVKVREFPALVSPISGRKSGGGYQSFDPSDAVLVAELRRQAVQSLTAWLNRYRGVMEAGGTDLSQIEALAVSIEKSLESAA